MAPGLPRDLAFATIGLLLLLCVPLIGSKSLDDFVIYVIAYGLLAMSLNLLVGYTGLTSFGHAMFFGAGGAYPFGLMMQNLDLGIPLAFALTILFAMALALVIGAICIRLTEIYFAFLTLAFQMLIYSIIISWVSFTGGDQGLMGGIPKPPFLGIDLGKSGHLYAFCCALFVVCLLLMRVLVQSPFGYTLRLIRDNAHRAGFLGVDVFRVKLTCFVIAAAFGAVGGLVLTLFVSGAYPNFAYWTMSGEAIFMIMLGGMNVFLGPVVGAAILHLLNDLVTHYTKHYGLFLGSLILLIVLGFRRGLLDFALEKLQPRGKR